MADLGFERAIPADTGQPGYDPRGMLKLCLYATSTKSGRRDASKQNAAATSKLCGLLERLYPDYKSIAEFCRMHREAVTATGAELIRFAKTCDLIHGEWVAVQESGFSFNAISMVWSRQTENNIQRSIFPMSEMR